MFAQMKPQKSIVDLLERSSKSSNGSTGLSFSRNSIIQGNMAPNSNINSSMNSYPYLQKQIFPPAPIDFSMSQNFENNHKVPQNNFGFAQNSMVNTQNNLTQRMSTGKFINK